MSNMLAPPQMPVSQPPAPPPPAPGVMQVYDLTKGKYDLAVEAGPSYTTRREEAADMITTFIQAYPASGPILGPMLAKMSDWPEADKVSDLLATMMPPEAKAIFTGQTVPPPGPPPELLAKQAEAQADMQLEQQKAQHQFHLAQQAQQNKMQIEQQQAQADVAVMREKASAEMQIMRERAALEMQLKREEARLAAELKAVGAAQTAMNAPSESQVAP